MALPTAPPLQVTVQTQKHAGELDSTQWTPGNGCQMTVKRSISFA